MKLRLITLTMLAMLLALPATGFTAEKPGEGVTVNPGRATWSTGFFLEALYSRGLEELGYKVKDAKDLSNPIFYQSVTQGDVDFWANGWFPLHEAQLPKNFEDKAKLAGTVAEAGALQGYLASKEHVEKFGIKTLADFEKDEVKKAFDANGDGKADLVACPPGWGCEKVITSHFEQYGFGDYLNPIKASYSASMADALARYNQGEPILFYTWTPNWTVYKLKPGEDVLWIGVPGHEGQDENEIATGVKGAVSDPINMGFVANDINVVANLEFLNENPAAAKFFEAMSVPLSDIATQNNKMFEGEDKQADIERHVDEWIAANKDKWEDALSQAREAAM